MKLASDQLDFLNEADNLWASLSQTNQRALLETIAVLQMQIQLFDEAEQLQTETEDNHDQ